MGNSILIFVLALEGLAQNTPLERATRMYRQTDYSGALRILLPLETKPAPVLALIGKSYYMSGEFRPASEYFQKAAAAEPGKAEHRLWLGRAFGRRAETANWFSAPGLAKQARAHFEKAVELDPRNIEAISDLLQYYLEAPGFLGGGEEKARALAARLKDVDPAEYHSAEARIAEHRREYGLAEMQLRRAIELAPSQAGRLVDLARLLSKTGRYRESEQYFSKAEKAAPNDPQLMFERASAYIQAGRNLEQARALLKKYLESALTPENPPRDEAEKLLRKTTGG